MNVLHIDSGISPTDSVSRLLTAGIVKRIQAADTSLTITYHDLIADPVPYMNFRTLPSAHPASTASDLLSEEDRRARCKTEEALNDFLAADAVILGIPMYNFGIAAQLKSWLDAIVIPGKTFTYTPEGPVGLAACKRVVLAISRGSFYGENGFLLGWNMPSPMCALSSRSSGLQSPN